MQGCGAANISRGNSVRSASTPQKVPLTSAGAGAREPRGSSRNSVSVGRGLETLKECLSMCDYSLEHENSRPAKVGEKLSIQRFRLGTRGFVSPDDCKTAVCVLPGTELAFADSVTCYGRAGLLGWKPKVFNHTTAIFRQVNKDIAWTRDGASASGTACYSDGNQSPRTGSTHRL